MSEAKVVICPACGSDRTVASNPKEVKRELIHETIQVDPDEQVIISSPIVEPSPDAETPKPSGQMTLSILRVTYEREYSCISCRNEWVTTYEVERQRHV